MHTQVARTMALSCGLLLSDRKLPRHEDNEAPGLAGGEDENRTQVTASSLQQREDARQPIGLPS